VDIPEFGASFFALTAFVEFVEVVHEQIIVENVEELPAVELYIVDEKQGMVYGR
jgi:hypothetical protein